MSVLDRHLEVIAFATPSQKSISQEDWVLLFFPELRAKCREYVKKLNPGGNREKPRMRLPAPATKR